MQQRRAVLKVKKATPASALTLADVIGQVAAEPSLENAQTSLARDRVVTLEGIWPGAVAPTLAAWLTREPQPLLIVCAHVAEAESLAAELGELCAARIEVLPPGSEDNEFESLQHQETAQRLHVLSWLYRLSHGEAAEATPVVVTTLAALLQKVPSPESLEGDKRVLVAGKQVDLDDLRKWLVTAGYHATSSVQLPESLGTEARS